MKLLLLILLPFFSFAQASTYELGDSTWITSSDTGRVKVYKNPGRRAQYDTIRPTWKQASDTTKGCFRGTTCSPTYVTKKKRKK